MAFANLSHEVLSFWLRMEGYRKQFDIDERSVGLVQKYLVIVRAHPCIAGRIRKSS